MELNTLKKRDNRKALEQFFLTWIIVLLRLFLGPPQFHPTPPQFNTWVSHKRATPYQPPEPISYTPKTPQFNTSLSSTPRTPQINTKTPSVQPPSVQHTPRQKIALFKRCGTERYVELRGLWCGTEGFLVLNWGILSAENLWSWCVSDAWNWVLDFFINKLEYDFLPA